MMSGCGVGGAGVVVTGDAVGSGVVGAAVGIGAVGAAVVGAGVGDGGPEPSVVDELQMYSLLI
jgi:hypothetical protein